jgi:hypothetical protein
MEIIIKQQAISSYVNSLKEKFGTNLGTVIEDVIYDDMNMDFEFSEEWNDEEFARWAKMDLEWNAVEAEIQTVDKDFADNCMNGILSIAGIEKYFV